MRKLEDEPYINYYTDSNVFGSRVGADPEAQFSNSVMRNNVVLRVGRLVKLLSTTRGVAKKHRFGNHKHIVDLATATDGWPLHSGESAVFFSNEWIALPSDNVGLIISRVANYDKGLIVATSYLDSLWRGLVKLHITNTSGRTQWIEPGREIARLFLATAENVGMDSSEIARFSDHYGKSWDTILRQEDRDPFIQPANRPANFGAAFVRNTNDFLKRYAGYGILTLLGMGAAAGVNLYTKVDEPIANAQRIPAIEAQLDELDQASLRTGVESVLVEAGAARGQSTFDVQNLTVRDSTYVDAYLEEQLPRAGADALILRRANQPSIELTVQLDDPVDEDTLVNVKWLIVP
jgi:deoxycytidine triphosphate deaminase